MSKPIRFILSEVEIVIPTYGMGQFKTDAPRWRNWMCQYIARSRFGLKHGNYIVDAEVLRVLQQVQREHDCSSLGQAFRWLLTESMA
jgi:hypothetical protein